MLQPATSASTIPEVGQSQPPNLQVYPARYVCAVLFVKAALINSFPTCTLVAASTVAEDICHHTKATITLCSLADHLMIHFVMFHAFYMLDHVGLKMAQNVAYVSMRVDSLVRLSINNEFAGYLFGTFVTTMGAIVLRSAPQKFVSNWFQLRGVPSQKLSKHAIVMLTLYASDALGILMSGLSSQNGFIPQPPLIDFPLGIYSQLKYEIMFKRPSDQLCR